MTSYYDTIVSWWYPETVCNETKVDIKIDNDVLKKAEQNLNSVPGVARNWTDDVSYISGNMIIVSSSDLDKAISKLKHVEKQNVFTEEVPPMLIELQNYFKMKGVNYTG